MGLWRLLLESLCSPGRREQRASEIHVPKVLMSPSWPARTALIQHTMNSGPASVRTCGVDKLYQGWFRTDTPKSQATKRQETDCFEQRMETMEQTT